MVPANGQTTTRKGGPVSFECRTTGNPNPVVQWSKRVKIKKMFKIFFINLKKFRMVCYQLGCKSKAGIYYPSQMYSVNMQGFTNVQLPMGLDNLSQQK